MDFLFLSFSQTYDEHAFVRVHSASPLGFHTETHVPRALRNRSVGVHARVFVDDVEEENRGGLACGKGAGEQPPSLCSAVFLP